MSKRVCTHISGGYAGALCSKCAPEAVADLEAKNARLQERVKEADHRLAEANEAQREIEAACLRARKERDNARSHAKRLNTLHNAEKAVRDGYKAQSEQRREALELAHRAISETAAALITVKPKLEEVYLDDPRWSPWTRWFDRSESSPWRLLSRANVVARAAIDVTPEQAREKEGKR